MGLQNRPLVHGLSRWRPGGAPDAHAGRAGSRSGRRRAHPPRPPEQEAERSPAILQRPPSTFVSLEFVTRIARAAAAAFLVLLAILHVIKPELDPSWRPASEYAIGDYGWVMTIAIFSMALSCVALCAAVRSQIATIGGRIGLCLLLIVAAALVMAGIFVVDPVTIKGPEEMTTHGTLHGLAGAIFIPGLPIAGVLVSRSLRRAQAWRAAMRSIRWTAHLMWTSVAAMSVDLITVVSSGGILGPGSRNGWLNRLVVLSYCAWLMTVSWRAIQLRKNAVDASV